MSGDGPDNQQMPEGRSPEEGKDQEDEDISATIEESSPDVAGTEKIVCTVTNRFTNDCLKYL